MGELLAFLADRLSRQWHRNETPLLATLLAAAALSYLITDAWRRPPGAYALITSLVLTAGLPIYWLVAHRLPRTTPGRVGIVVAIAAERHAEEQRVQNDLIASFRDRMAEDPRPAFELLVMPNYVAETLVDAASVGRVLQRVRGHFMVYGLARWREYGGRRVPHLILNGVVRHKPAPEEAQQDLALDFSRSLPRRVVLNGPSEIFSFEATAEWIDLTARYILAIAAFLSGDVQYSERLFLSVEERLRRSSLKYPPLREMARRLPQRLIVLYNAWLEYLADRYYITRDEDVLRLSDDVARKLLDRDMDHYLALLTRAIAAFQLTRDLEAAKAFIRGCRKQKDATWRYSKAFLHAYEGDMDSASAEYERAFRVGTRYVNVPLQTEEFIQAVLTREPEKFQLFYCVALINDRVKQDAASAREDYQTFIREATARSAYPRQVADARRALEALGA